MNVVDQFLVSVLKYKDVEALAKLNKSWVDAKELVRYRFITDYYREHKEFPGVRSYLTHFKVDATDIDSRPSLYLGKVKERYVFTELAFKISLYKPSIVMVDGSYLMEPELSEGWEKIMAITRGLKNQCKDFRIPIVNTTKVRAAFVLANVSR